MKLCGRATINGVYVVEGAHSSRGIYPCISAKRVKACGHDSKGAATTALTAQSVHQHDANICLRISFRSSNFRQPFKSSAVKQNRFLNDPDSKY